MKLLEMKLLKKHYLYYIVYELQDGSKAEKSAIELELRQPITSIAHCEAISEYILESLGLDSRGPSAKKSTRKASRKKTKSQKAAPRALVLSFTLLRTQTRFFGK